MKRPPPLVDRLGALLRTTTRQCNAERGTALPPGLLDKHHRLNFDMFAQEVFGGPEAITPRQIATLLGAICAWPKMITDEEGLSRKDALLSSFPCLLANLEAEAEVLDETDLLESDVLARKRLIMSIHYTNACLQAIMKITGTQPEEYRLVQEHEAMLGHDLPGVRRHWQKLSRNLQTSLALE